MFASIGKQAGESVESVLEKKGRLRWGGFAEKEGFKPAMKDRAGDGILMLMRLMLAA